MVKMDETLQIILYFIGAAAVLIAAIAGAIQLSAMNEQRMVSLMSPLEHCVYNCNGKVESIECIRACREIYDGILCSAQG
jgi:hypothetical protein